MNPKDLEGGAILLAVVMVAVWTAFVGFLLHVAVNELLAGKLSWGGAAALAMLLALARSKVNTKG